MAPSIPLNSVRRIPHDLPYPQTASLLFSLPPEILNEVTGYIYNERQFHIKLEQVDSRFRWEYYSPPPNWIDECYANTTDPSPRKRKEYRLGFISTCRQAYLQALPFLHATPFTMELSKTGDYIGHVEMFPNLHLLQKIRIVIGPGHFFASVLAWRTGWDIIRKCPHLKELTVDLMVWHRRAAEYAFGNQIWKKGRFHILDTFQGVLNKGAKGTLRTNWVNELDPEQEEELENAVQCLEKEGWVVKLGVLRGQY